MLGFFSKKNDTQQTKTAPTWRELAKNDDLVEEAIRYIKEASEALKEYHKSFRIELKENDLEDYLKNCKESIKREKNNAPVIADNMDRFYPAYRLYSAHKKRMEENTNNDDLLSTLTFLLKASVKGTVFIGALALWLVFFLECLIKGNENGEKNFYEVAQQKLGPHTNTLFASMAIVTIMGFLFISAADEDAETLNNQNEDVRTSYENTIKCRIRI